MVPRPCWKFCNIFHNIFGSFPSMSPHGYAIFYSFSSKILWLLSKKCPYQFHILNDNVNWIFKEINFYVEIETKIFKIKGNQEEINFQSLFLAFPQLPPVRVRILAVMAGQMSMDRPTYFPSTSGSSGKEMVVEWNFTHLYQLRLQNWLMLAVLPDMMVLGTSSSNWNMLWAVCDLT